MTVGDRDARRAMGEHLLGSSPVTLFHRVDVLDRTLATLREAGYHVLRASATQWRTPKDMHRELARLLHFPDYYGENLDAFNDCLGDVAERAYGFPSDATGLVLVLTGYDTFAREFPELAHGLLDIFALRSRDALLSGEHLVCLVQSTDPRFSLPPVAATPVPWNEAERRDTDRDA
ncbi:barstar family protein [Plantactinospora endophytica]|uniref:Barstar (barnase inhibitor) domain-containing protein n=1 Tax=Plantactinospora endophytica TaxID=673535 RepID=A0ABQ4E1M1_9ACTN|nr:barstar family protein [Plantactinospora endophytica]GIG88609.1 hypothetical protein Pen02_35450 [Plantactinospora endophytica]